LLDRYAANTPAVHAAYRRAMNLELAFFEANTDEPPDESEWRKTP
jgi:hypothetical protein